MEGWHGHMNIFIGVHPAVYFGGEHHKIFDQEQETHILRDEKIMGEEETDPNFWTLAMCPTRVGSTE